jgi:hypothetical protein
MVSGAITMTKKKFAKMLLPLKEAFPAQNLGSTSSRVLQTQMGSASTCLTWLNALT